MTAKEYSRIKLGPCLVGRGPVGHGPAKPKLRYRYWVFN